MTLPWKWSIAGGVFAGKPQDEIIEICSQAGYDGIEGRTAMFTPGKPAELEAARKAYNQAGLVIDTFHLPFSGGDDIASFYETLRRETVQKMRMWMEAAHVLGTKVCVLHPTTTRFDAQLEGFDRYLAAMGRSLEELLPLAAELDLVLALENMQCSGVDRFGSNPDHLKTMAREFADDHLGFCLDTGHALISLHDRAHEVTEAMGDRLIAFHLADTAGDKDSHLAPGRGHVDWQHIFRTMRSLGYTGTACIETSPFAYGPDYSLEAYTQLLSDTKKLAEKALQ